MTLQPGPCVTGERLQRRARLILPLTALPFLLNACPDAPRAPEPETLVRPNMGAPPARIERAAVLLEPNADAPAGGLRGAVVFEETTVTAQDGASVVTLVARYRVFGLTGPYGTNYRLRIEPTARCADPAAGPGVVVGREPLDAMMGGADGTYRALESDGLALGAAIVGHAVTVLDGDDAVILCGVARRSADQVP